MYPDATHHRTRIRRCINATLAATASVAGVIILTTASAPRAAATAAEAVPPAGALIVNNGTSTDPSDLPAACGTAPYTTIQSAELAASAGATIYVCAGTYPESVSITKNLTFDGAQMGVDARTGRTDAADETVVASPVAAGYNDFAYEAPATTGTIDGFTISGVTNPTFSTYGIVAFNDIGGGYHWVDNIITDIDYTIFLDTAADPAQTVIRDNLMEHSPEVLWEGYDYGPGADYTANNVLITDNAFEDNGNQDVHFDGSHDLSNKATGLIVTDNTSDNDASFLLVIDTSGAEIDDNTITWTGGAGTSGITRFCSICIDADNLDTTVSGNTLTGSDTGTDDPYYWDQYGITASSSYGSGTPSVGVTITHNTITGQVFGISLRNASADTASGYVVSDNTIGDSVLTNDGNCSTDAQGYLDGGVGIFVQDQNYLPGATAGTTIENQGFTITGNTITDPACKGIWVQNVGPTSVNIDGTISGNTATGAGVYDCQDQTSGPRTVGTDNTWTDNIADTDSPAGLCVDPALTVTETANPTTYTAAGQTVTYTFVVTNTGTTPLTGVTLDDGFTGASAADHLASGPTCPDPSLSPGQAETCTATYVVTRSDITTLHIDNAVTASGTDPDGVATTSAPSSAGVVVAQPTLTSSVGTTTVSTLAQTGIDILDLLQLAGGLFVLGGFLVLVGRRRTIVHRE